MARESGIAAVLCGEEEKREVHLNPLSLNPCENHIRTIEYWDERSSKSTFQVVDPVLGIVKSIDDGYVLNYTKVHIGLAQNGRANNFILMYPKKNWLRIGIRLY